MSMLITGMDELLVSWFQALFQPPSGHERRYAKLRAVIKFDRALDADTAEPFYEIFPTLMRCKLTDHSYSRNVVMPASPDGE